MKILGLEGGGGVLTLFRFYKGFDGGTGHGMHVHCHVAGGHVTTLGTFEFTFSSARSFAELPWKWIQIALICWVWVICWCRSSSSRAEKATFKELFIGTSYPQFTYDFFHMYHSFTYLSREHMNPKLTCSQRQWLHSSVGRTLKLASHRYREVTGSSPVEVLNFFQASLRNCKNCDHNCEDHSSFDTGSLLFMDKGP